MLNKKYILVLKLTFPVGIIGNEKQKEIFVTLLILLIFSPVLMLFNQDEFYLNSEDLKQAL